MYMVDGTLNLRPIECIISYYMDKINFIIYYYINIFTYLNLIQNILFKKINLEVLQIILKYFQMKFNYFEYVQTYKKIFCEISLLLFYRFSLIKLILRMISIQ